jgi:hypothetical protein
MAATFWQAVQNIGRSFGGEVFPLCMHVSIYVSMHVPLNLVVRVRLLAAALAYVKVACVHTYVPNLWQAFERIISNHMHVFTII